MTQPAIVFVDNTVSRIFSSVNALSGDIGRTAILQNETELRELLAIHKPDIIFLHLDLKPNDAVQLLGDLRRTGLSGLAYIVIYSEKQDDFIQELAFDQGADAFINFFTKPILLELFIRNLLRRRRSSQGSKTGKLQVDSEALAVIHNNRQFFLPLKEFRVFELLFSRADSFVSKKEIAEEIWGDEKFAKTRAIDTHICNIRKRLGKNMIQTRKTAGYRINKKLM
jgi:two-component system, OmpR family, alkaline phosphatase synthesis response regulator PhoP